MSVDSEEKIELNDNKKNTKKIATGSTKKAVQRRSSSIAGKKHNQTNKNKDNKEMNNASKVTEQKLKNTDEKEFQKKEKNIQKQQERLEKQEQKKIHKEERQQQKIDTKNEKKEIREAEENRKKTEKNNKEITNQKQKQENIEKNAKKVQEPKPEEKFEKNPEQEKSLIAQDKEMQKMRTIVMQEIKQNKKMAQEEQKKIGKRIFQELCMAITVMLYINFIILGFINIESSVFYTDLKVFGIGLALLAVGIFEYAYKKDSGRYCIYGIEVLILSFITVALMYIEITTQHKFIQIAVLIAFIYSVYYVGKSIILFKKLKKQYIIDTMNEIIKK